MGGANSGSGLDRDLSGHADRCFDGSLFGEGSEDRGSDSSVVLEDAGKIRRSPTWLGSAITRYSHRR